MKKDEMRDDFFFFLLGEANSDFFLQPPDDQLNPTHVFLPQSPSAAASFSHLPQPLLLVALTCAHFSSWYANAISGGKLRGLRVKCRPAPSGSPEGSKLLKFRLSSWSLMVQLEVNPTTTRCWNVALFEHPFVESYCSCSCSLCSYSGLYIDLNRVHLWAAQSSTSPVVSCFIGHGLS